MDRKYKRPKNTKKIITELLSLFTFNNVKVTSSMKRVKSHLDYEGMYVTYNFGRSGNLVTLSVEDIISFPEEFEASMTKRMFEYITMMGYEDSPRNRFIMILLHEIGHIEWMNTVIEHELVDVMEHVQAFTHTMIPVAFMGNDIRDMREDGIDPLYFFRADETFADAFAIKYFLKAITHLENKNIDIEMGQEFETEEIK